MELQQYCDVNMLYMGNDKKENMVVKFLKIRLLLHLSPRSGEVKGQVSHFTLLTASLLSFACFIHG